MISANNSKANWIFSKTDVGYTIVANDYKGNSAQDFPFPNELTVPFEFQLQKLNRVIKFGNKEVHKVDDGYIVGTNNGEFGGGLLFIDNNVSNRYILHFGFRIKDIYEFNSKLYAIEGLAHLGSPQGSVIEIYKDTLWKFKEVLKLPDAPNLVLKMGSENLILTSKFLYKQRPDKIEKVLEAPFYWGMLYPSSMVVDNKDLYIAMRQGILKIASYDQSPGYEWYIPK